MLAFTYLFSKLVKNHITFSQIKKRPSITFGVKLHIMKMVCLYYVNIHTRFDKARYQTNQMSKKRFFKQKDDLI